MKNRLTKTDYLRFLKCPQEFWLSVHQPLLFAEPATLEYEHLRQQGYAVQTQVKRMQKFRSGKIGIVDFERAFETKDLYARCDLVVSNDAANVIDIYEIKASASVK